MKMDLPNRQSMRVIGHDYSTDGCYFITISSMERLCCFGHIENGLMILSENGFIAKQCIESIPGLNSQVTVPCYAVMPDHVHIVINVKEKNNEYIKDAKNPSSSLENVRLLSKALVPKIIQQYKSAVVKLSKQGGEGQRVYWHRGYYDRIIRNNNEFQAVCTYIAGNPANWRYHEHKELEHGD